MQILFSFYVISFWSLFAIVWFQFMPLQKLFRKKKKTCFALEKITHFCYWSTVQWKPQQQILSTLFQYCFVNVESTSINKIWLNFQPDINVKTTWWKLTTNVVSKLFGSRCARWEGANPMAHYRTNKCSRMWIIDVVRTL